MNRALALVSFGLAFFQVQPGMSKNLGATAFDANALTIQLTEFDFAALLSKQFFNRGEREISGFVPRMQEGITEIGYRFTLEQPKIDFQPNEVLNLSLRVSSANFQIGRIQKSKAVPISCEKLMLQVLPTKPLELESQIRIEKTGASLSLHILSFDLKNAEHIKTFRPEKCTGLGPLNALTRIALRAIVQSKLKTVKALLQKFVQDKIQSVNARGGWLGFESTFNLTQGVENKIAISLKPTELKTTEHTLLIRYAADFRSISNHSVESTACRSKPLPIPVLATTIQISKCWLAESFREFVKTSRTRPIEWQAKGHTVERFLVPLIAGLIPGLRDTNEITGLSFRIAFDPQASLEFETIPEGGVGFSLRSEGIKILISKLTNSGTTPLTEFRFAPQLRWMPVVTSDLRLGIVFQPGSLDAQYEGKEVDSELFQALITEILQGALTIHHPFPLFRIMSETDVTENSYRSKEVGDFIVLGIPRESIRSVASISHAKR